MKSTQTVNMILLLAAVLSPLYAKSDCVFKCDQIRYFRFQLICFDNGKVYGSTCHAKCARPYLKNLFDCGINPNFDECSERCKAQVFGSPNGNCESKCPLYFVPTSSCFSDGNLYMDTCRAHCFDKSLTHRFTCKFPLNENVDSCRQKCKNTGTFPIPLPLPLPLPPTQNLPSKCSKKKWVCSYEGNIYLNECALNFQSKDELRYKCYENGFNNPIACQNICNRFQNDKCLNQCFDNNQTPACFNDGNVYSDRCVPKCNGHKFYKECRGRGGVRKCRKLCKNFFRS